SAGPARWSPRSTARRGPTAPPPRSASVAPGQAELAFGQVAEDQLRADRGDAGQLGLPPQPLDVVLLRVTHSAEGLHGLVGGLVAVLPARYFAMLASAPHSRPASYTAAPRSTISHADSSRA